MRAASAIAAGAALLDPAAAAKTKASAGQAKGAGTPLTGGKRSVGEMEVGQMSGAQINKVLRQMQEGPAAASSPSNA